MGEHKLKTPRSMKMLISEWLKSNSLIANVLVEYHVIFSENIAFIRIVFPKTFGVDKTMNYMINLNSPHYLGPTRGRHIVEFLENARKGFVVKEQAADSSLK